MMNPRTLLRIWPSLGLLVLYGIEAGAVALGSFAAAAGLLAFTGALGVACALGLAVERRSIWSTVILDSQLMALACLILGRDGDRLAFAAWGVTHGLVLIALARGLVLRVRAGRDGWPGRSAAPPLR